LDLLDDAHNTFIKEGDDFEGEHEMQMDELNRNQQAFNWSDEELAESKGA